MTRTNEIGFGILIGSFFSMLSLVIFFGNDIEVLCILPSLILGVYLYNKK